MRCLVTRSDRGRHEGGPHHASLSAHNAPSQLMHTGAQGQSNRTGYLWLELHRPGGYPTVGALVRHSQSASGIKVWYFTTPLRVRDGLELISGAREPLSHHALTELIGAECLTDVKHYLVDCGVLGVLVAPSVVNR